MGYDVKKLMSKESYLQMHPYCLRCGSYTTRAVEVIKNMRGFPEPVCEDHYRDFCIGFGNFLVVSIMSGAGRRYRNV